MKQISLTKWYHSALTRLAALPFVHAAIGDHADLSAFKEKPGLRILTGVFLIILSFPLGWPAVSGLGILAFKLGNPWIVAVGGPLVYGFSHLVFLLGMFLSGAKYTQIFCRWLVRVVVERLLAWQ